MRCIEHCGKEYGLALNVDKIEALPVKCERSIRNFDHSSVKSCNSLRYLGCSLHSDGHMLGEVKQRFAIARDEFKQLSKFGTMHQWK